MATRPDLPVKLFYRIGEVAQLVGVETHVLRYWETEFRSLRPKKSAKGQRVYSRRDLEKLLRVEPAADRLQDPGARRQRREGRWHDVMPCRRARGIRRCACRS